MWRCGGYGWGCGGGGGKIAFPCNLKINSLVTFRRSLAYADCSRLDSVVFQQFRYLPVLQLAAFVVAFLKVVFCPWRLIQSTKPVYQFRRGDYMLIGFEDIPNIGKQLQGGVELGGVLLLFG